MESTTQPELIERDHVDDCLVELVGLPSVDLEVEGIVDRIIGLSRRIRRVMEQTLAEFELTYGEYQVLGWLRDAPGRRRSPGDLAAHAELTSGAMTNRLDQLEGAGLVRRLPDPTDRRSIQVELTDKGLETWTSAFAVQAEKEKLIAAALDSDEKHELNTKLRRLMLAFERQHPSG
jgi:DNA-binding MarR family transcriptional regulator